MSTNGLPHDPDDFFAETRMTFGDHIEDLRTHLWRAIFGFGIALFISFFFGHHVLQFITKPLKAELSRFYERRTRKILAQRMEDPAYLAAGRPTPFSQIQIPKKQWLARNGEDVKMPRPQVETAEVREKHERQTSAIRALWDKVFGDEEAIDPGENEEVYPIKEDEVDNELVTIWFRYPEPLVTEALLQEQARLYMDTENPATLNVQEAFVVWFKVCIVCGIVIGSPWIFWQIWAFVAAGLYPHEKKLVHVYLPVSLMLFLGGVAMCEFFVIPKAVSYLLWFNEWMGLKPDLRLNEWLGFAIFLPVVFGLCFQTPLVMLFAGRLGIVDAQFFRDKRRYIWFGMAFFSALITPPDAITMVLLWAPMGLLYELGIWLTQMYPGQSLLGTESEEEEELVEV
jgi:sec-independent protein translocase protein TatC